MPDARRRFHQELDHLEAETLATIDLLLESLDVALSCVECRDMGLTALLLADHHVDDRLVGVQESVLRLLTLQSPVAGDLRLTTALLHVIKHVERMSDQVRTIATLVPLGGHEPPVDDELLAVLLRMGALARAEAVQCRQAFALRDVTLALDLVRCDTELNRLNKAAFRRAVEAGTDEDRREWAMQVMLMARSLERIGDNAVDIGEQVVFVVGADARDRRLSGGPAPRPAAP